MVGNTTFCDFPEAARHVFKVGDFSNPSVEKIAALKPRLVFATLPEQRATVDKLKQMGISVFISRPNSLDSMFKEILAIGKVLAAARQADSLVRSLRARLDSIPCGTAPAKVYLEISGQPLMTVGKSSFINEAVLRAGGTNVFGDVEKEYPVVTQEQVIGRDPDVVFILHPQATRTEFLARLGWRDVNAVKNGRVFDDVNPDLLFRSGPRIVDGIEAMAARIAGRR